MQNRAADSFMAFVRPQWRRLHLTARQYVASDADAADLVQETMLRAWRNYAPADEGRYRRAWLLTILRNLARERHRQAGRRIRIVPTAEGELTDLSPIDLGDAFAALPGLDEQRFRELLDDRIASALAALPDAFREVIVLSVAGDLNYREIAETLDCPVGTVMSRMARARRALRERLADLVGVEASTAQSRPPDRGSAREGRP